MTDTNETSLSIVLAHPIFLDSSQHLFLSFLTLSLFFSLFDPCYLRVVGSSDMTCEAQCLQYISVNTSDLAPQAKRIYKPTPFCWVFR